MEKGKRPLTILFLSILHIVTGIAIFALSFLPAKTDFDLESIFGVPFIFFTISILFLATISLVAGIGMLMGKSWGWWLACFYYIYNIFRQFNVLLTIPTLLEEYGPPERGVQYHVLRSIGRILFSILIIIFLFRKKVLNYFGLENQPKVKTIGIMIGVVIGIFVISSIILAFY